MSCGVCKEDLSLGHPPSVTALRAQLYAANNVRPAGIRLLRRSPSAINRTPTGRLSSNGSLFPSAPVPPFRPPSIYLRSPYERSVVKVDKSAPWKSYYSADGLWHPEPAQSMLLSTFQTRRPATFESPSSASGSVGLRRPDGETKDRRKREKPKNVPHRPLPHDHSLTLKEKPQAPSAPNISNPSRRPNAPGKSTRGRERTTFRPRPSGHHRGGRVDYASAQNRQPRRSFRPKGTRWIPGPAGQPSFPIIASAAPGTEYSVGHERRDVCPARGCRSQSKRQTLVRGHLPSLRLVQLQQQVQFRWKTGSPPTKLDEGQQNADHDNRGRPGPFLWSRKPVLRPSIPRPRKKGGEKN